MSASSSGPRVAVLDDDHEVAAAVAIVLCRTGMAAQEFTDADVLLAAACAYRFDAYVLDWLLGDITALDLIAQLRNLDSSCPAPIFLLSGNLAFDGVPTDTELAAAIRRYSLNYRAKPYSTLKLAQDLQVAMNGGLR